MEQINPQPNYLLPALTRESEAAQEVKERKILVILGNPPYSGHSLNPSSRLVPASDMVKPGKGIKYKSAKKDGVKYYEVPTAIGEAIETYKRVEEEDFTGKRVTVALGEKNPKWLHDDYVKFIRFAQAKMDATSEGVVGVITNHAFLDNVTFRGMRDSLLKTFDQIHIFDLHGSTKPRESAPDNMLNENVFDIQKGVAITLFIKRDGVPKGVWRTDVWGARQQKYEWAASTKFEFGQELYCDQPMWPFYPVDRQIYREYYSHASIKDVFDSIVLGYQTHRDHFAVDIDESEIRGRITAMRSDASDKSLRSRYNIEDNRDWKLADARDLIKARDDDSRLIIKTTYRPFDLRWCIFGPEAMDYPRRELLDHVANRSNIQLLVPRQARGEWRHALVASDVAESCAISDQTKEQNYNIPLYLFAPAPSKGDQPTMFDRFGGKDKIENIHPKFREWIDQRYGLRYTPEDILGYVYAILHARGYQSRYEDFLRRDFPRIPFPEVREKFETLSRLGWELVEAHLMRSPSGSGPGDRAEVPASETIEHWSQRTLGSPMEQGSNVVEQVRWSDSEQKLWINPKQGFANVPRRVWEFKIGGYQVLDKYLKSRKDRTLSLDEIEQVELTINILDFTADQKALIQEAYLSSFGKSVTGVNPVTSDASRGAA